MSTTMSVPEESHAEICAVEMCLVKIGSKPQECVDLIVLGDSVRMQIHFDPAVIEQVGANIFKDLFASIRDIVGGRAGSYEKVLQEARDTALQELSQRAQMIGANAVIAIDVDYEVVGQSGSMLMVSVSGTAVVI